MTERPEQSDVHALSGAYAVDALDPDERTLFEEHLRSCPACQEEVDSIRETTASLSDVTAAEPPAGLRDRILAEVETVRPLPPRPAPEARASERSRRRWPFGLSDQHLMLAAAVVIVVTAVGAALWRPWVDTSEPRLSAAEQVLTADDALRTSQSLPRGAEATVVLSRTEGRVVLLTQGLSPAPDGHAYQLWLQTPAGELESAGLLPAAGDVTYLLEGDASDATGVGITVEPEEGSQQPTTDPIAMFELPA